VRRERSLNLENKRHAERMRDATVMVLNVCEKLVRLTAFIVSGNNIDT